MMEKGESSLLRLVEEKAISREKEMSRGLIEEEKTKHQEDIVIPYLPSDCISNILVRLPIESLPQLRFICKPWYKIINSPTFIDAHFRSSNTVLIFLHTVGRDISLPAKGKSNLFPVESKLRQPDGPFGLRKSMFDPLLLYSINFLEITGQKGMVKEYNATCLGNIRASYNGLILLDNYIKKGGLIMMNPVTREAVALPVGTLFPSVDESYGLAFCSHVNDYKVVHLFKDHLRYVGCEILDLSTRRWRMVDGPPFDFFNWLGCEPVFANEALYWLPRVESNDYLVYFALDDEKFLKLPLPKSCSSDDSIFQMAGKLGLVTHEEPCRIILWALSSSCAQGWKKQYNISVDCKHVIPLYCNEETDEFVFTDTIGYLYSYDLYLHYTEKIEAENGSSAVHGRYVPHVNSLLSWRTQPKGQYVDD